jgi:hypothetical protein
MARILAVTLQPSGGSALAPVGGITAIYNFGDSISDTGNLNNPQGCWSTL